MNSPKKESSFSIDGLIVFAVSLALLLTSAILRCH